MKRVIVIAVMLLLFTGCTPDAPTMWQIEYGTSFSVRCYEVQISQGDEAGKLKILMIGTLETNDRTLENTGDVLP